MTIEGPAALVAAIRARNLEVARRRAANQLRFRDRAPRPPLNPVEQPPLPPPQAVGPPPDHEIPAAIPPAIELEPVVRNHDAPDILAPDEQQDQDSRTTNILNWLDEQHRLFEDAMDIPALDEFHEQLSAYEWQQWVAENTNTAPPVAPIPHQGMRPMLQVWTKEGVTINPTKTVPRTLQTSTYVRKDSKIAYLLEEELKKLVIQGHIIPCAQSEVHVTHPIFAVPKSSQDHSKVRLVYDARFINSFLKTPNFSLPQVPKSLQAVPVSSYGFVSDVSAGYHHISLLPAIRKYFGLAWKGQFFLWKALPFGLSTAPWIFQKWLESYLLHFKKAIATFRPLSAQYLDDVNMINKNLSENEQTKIELLAYYAAHNIQAHPTKTTDPSQRFTFLGYIVDTVKGTVALSEKRQSQMTLIFEHVKARSSLPRSFVQKLCGLVNWTRRGSKSILNMTKRWYQALHANPKARMVRIDKSIIPAIQDSLSVEVPFRHSVRPYVMYTDSTLTQGAWVTPSPHREAIFDVPYEYQHSSFEAEFYTAQLALRQVARPGMHVHLWCDNLGTCFAIKKGSCNHRRVQQVLYKLLVWLETNRIKVTPIWVPSELNPADEPSRRPAGLSPFGNGIARWLVQGKAAVTTWPHESYISKRSRVNPLNKIKYK